MSRDRFVLYTLLGFVLVAVIGMAFIVSLQKHQAAVPQSVSSRPENTRSAPAKPDYDFTTLLPEDTASAIAARPQQKKDTAPLTQPVAQYTQPTGRPVTLRVEPIRVEKIPVRTSAQLPTLGSSNTSVTASNSSKNLLASNTRPTRSYSATGPEKATIPTSYSGSKSAKDSSKPSSGEEILDAYTPYQTISQQRALNQKIQDMRDGVDRALLEAMAPKGKREQNLEKYMPSNGQDNETNASSAGANAAATSEVSQQLATQAQQVVGQMRRNYGDAVAGQASEIMNDFQQEMASLLNSPLPQEEKMIKAQELNNKYNEKLRDLNESAGKSKMEDRLKNENTEYLSKITQTYGGEVASIVSPILDKYATLRLANWTTPQSEAEAIANEADLQDKMHKELEDVLNKRGYKGDVTSMLEGPTREQILKSGPDNTPVFRQTEEGQKARETSWKKEGQEIVDTFSQLGDKAKQDAQQLVNGLLEGRKKLYQQAQEEGWTRKKLAQKEMEMVDKFNQQSKNLYNTTVAGNYNKQYEKNFQNMPEDVKRQMRPIWEEGNLKLAELDNTLMKDEDRKKQKEQILQEMEKRMQKILQNAE
ncbi:MAG: hypothetical protein IKN49_05965 [Elusimicrobiaceae bacterium]|nr:hypothetical protein [Elusimicrobiaceae bacterium]